MRENRGTSKMMASIAPPKKMVVLSASPETNAEKGFLPVYLMYIKHIAEFDGVIMQSHAKHS